MSVKSLKKKKQREKKVKKIKQVARIKMDYVQKFPQFIIEGKYADIELTTAIKKITSQLDFRKAPTSIQSLFNDLKTLDHRDLVKKHNRDFFDAYSEQIECKDYIKEINSMDDGLLIYDILEDIISKQIYKILTDMGLWQKFMPLHHLNVGCYQGDIRIEIDSFRVRHSTYGPGYYTGNPAKVKIDNNEFIVAASMHAIERISERMGKGHDFHRPSLMNYCMSESHLSHIKLSDGQDAIKIEFPFEREGGSSLTSYAHKLAFDLFREIPSEFYYLCGYAPIGFSNSKEFVHLKTFLEPGMNGTPENVLFNTVRYRDKIKYKDVLRKNEMDEGYHDLRKFFHENGCDQIRI